MSDSNPNQRYAAWFEPFVMTVMIAVILLIVGLYLRSELRDAQRRIAVLEQRCQ